MPDAGRTHGPPATKKQAAVTTGKGRNNRHSLRDGFNGLSRALPGDRALIASVAARDHHPRDLIPASGDQDHTPLPSARMLSSARVMRAEPPCVHRIPPPYVRDDRDTPLQWRRDGKRITMYF